MPTPSSGRTLAPTRSPALDADERGEVIRRKAGLPPATYFSGGKLQWLLEHVEGLRAAAERGDALFGTPDTWVIWNLTGGPDGGRHVTDVTNASRTMLMDLQTLDWDDELLGFFGVPRAMLPQILPSCDAGALRRRRPRPAAALAVPSDSRATSATSRPRPSARSASPPARQRTPTAQAISCCSTPEPRSSAPRPGC
jgi:glycerol kinase